MNGVLPGHRRRRPQHLAAHRSRPSASRPGHDAQVARAAFPNGCLLIRVRDALGEPFLYVVGLRLKEVDGERVHGTIALGERQHTPCGLVHGSDCTTASWPRTPGRTRMTNS